MLTFTLDTNCIIALDDGRADAPAIRQLADAHAQRRAHVAVVAMSASERQRNGAHLGNFQAFRDRLAALGFGHLEILKPISYWDVTFWDWSLWSAPEMEVLEQQIHDILFPTIEFRWIDFCSVRGWDPKVQTLDAKWRNAKCDVQALWSHVFNKRDVFVTSDANFHAATKKAALLAVGAGRIQLPNAAVASVIGVTHAA